jgi:SAM-dependent methyltransferase
MNRHDPFSFPAREYLKYRPKYPDSLVSYVASLAPAHELAWDCATGNGQAAVGLARYFRSIVALDADIEQLALARRDHRIAYVRALAYRTPLARGSVDLVTVASAFHWLNLEKFYPEVCRVSKPGGILACWGYKRPEVIPEIDAVIERFDTEVLRGFWLPETQLATEGYRKMWFPFHPIDPPPFRITRRWTMGRLMGFLRTWSASLRYADLTRRDPMEEIRGELTAAWGDPKRKRRVVLDLFMRVGRIGDP